MDEHSSVIEVELTTLTYGGDTLGRLADGRAVFVPFSMPGETVRAKIREERQGFVRADLVEVLKPSPDRIQPKCAHFTQCGGCHYQHIPYYAQLSAKTAIVKDQLTRIGGFVDPPVLPIHPSPMPWNYRNAVQFHLTENGKLGYQAPNSHQVIPIQECHLPEGALNEVWQVLDFEPIPGLERIDLRLGAGDDILLVLKGKDPSAPEFSVDFPLSAVYEGPGGSVVMSGDDHTLMELGGITYSVSAGSFFQVNTLVAQMMVDELMAHLPLTPQTKLLDLYCGVGLFSAHFAPHVGELIGVELSASACGDFAVNLDPFDNVTLYEGAAEEILPSLDEKPDVVVVDPPRAGLAPKALDAVARMQPEVIAYVSCDPSTLARDAKRLCQKGYRLTRVQPFDMFPQTYHVECVVLMTRVDKP
jgi:23S rRNA (uracil1939-C5)-methyltransferase